MTDAIPLSPTNPACDPFPGKGHFVELGSSMVWAYMPSPCPECGFNYTEGEMGETTCVGGVILDPINGHKHQHDKSNSFVAKVTCPKGHSVDVSEDVAACWCGWRREHGK